MRNTLVQRLLLGVGFVLSLSSAAGAWAADKPNRQVAVVDDSAWRSGPSEAWFINWDKALAEARKTRKALFVLNTGSDWCYWCKKLHNEVLDKPEFLSFAEKKLVLLYLDSPNRDPLGKEQKRHNRQIVKALGFGGGVPSVVLASANGKRLGAIGGGGQSLEDYLRRVESVLGADGQDFETPDALLLFKQGYAALAEKVAAQLASLPPVTKDDFVVRVTGVAVVDLADACDPDTVAFKAADTSLDVPFGGRALIRMEYDLPKGYAARILVQASFPREESAKMRYFRYAPSELLKGKGVFYGVLNMSDKGQSCEVKKAVVRIRTEPEMDDFPYGWTISPVPVSLKFAAREGSDGGQESVTGNPVSPPKAPADDRKWRKGPDRLWYVNWDKAVAEAKKTKKKLFVLNTGSDWCGWCRKLKADVLSSGKFKTFARKNLVLVYLDSPRQKPLSQEQQTYNRELAKFLSFGGGVPCVKIVDPEDNSVLETISGYKPAQDYLRQLQEAVQP